MNRQELIEVMLDADTPMTRKVRAAALRMKRELKPFSPDKEVWHHKTKKWLDHKDPQLAECQFYRRVK